MGNHSAIRYDILLDATWMNPKNHADQSEMKTYIYYMTPFQYTFRTEKTNLKCQRKQIMATWKRTEGILTSKKQEKNF